MSTRDLTDEENAIVLAALRKFVDEKGWTATRLGKKLDVTQPTATKWLAGKQKFSRPNAESIALIQGTTFDRMLGREGASEPTDAIRVSHVPNWKTLATEAKKIDPKLTSSLLDEVGRFWLPLEFVAYLESVDVRDLALVARRLNEASLAMDTPLPPPVRLDAPPAPPPDAPKAEGDTTPLHPPVRTKQPSARPGDKDEERPTKRPKKP